MEEDIENYLSTVMFRRTPAYMEPPTKIKTQVCWNLCFKKVLQVKRLNINCNFVYVKIYKFNVTEYIFVFVYGNQCEFKRVQKHKKCAMPKMYFDYF